MRKLAFLLLIAPLALAACGGSHASSSQRLVQQALAKTAHASSANVAFTVSAKSLVQTGRGVLDNRGHLVRLTFKPTSTGEPAAAVVSDKTAYYRFPGQGWIAVDMHKVSSSARLSDLEQTPYLLSHLKVQRVTALGPGHFDVWASGLAQPLYISIASTGYISQLHMRAHSSFGTVVETLKLSDFGHGVHVTIPQAISSPVTANADGSFSLASARAVKAVRTSKGTH
jgi:hypothetical protein